MLAEVLQKKQDGTERFNIENAVISTSMTKEQISDDTKRFSYKDFYEFLKSADKISTAQTSTPTNIARG